MPRTCKSENKRVKREMIESMHSQSISLHTKALQLDHTRILSPMQRSIGLSEKYKQTLNNHCALTLNIHCALNKHYIIIVL